MLVVGKVSDQYGLYILYQPKARCRYFLVAIY